MASTNKTTHYELSQYIGTDKPTYLVDYNTDMNNIDTGIYNAQSKANTNETAIGNLSNLNTTDKTSIVNAINETNTEASSNTNNIGNLSNLTTSANTNLVSAINEVDAHTDTNNQNIGTMVNLETTIKTSLVGAINEVNTGKNNNTQAINDLKPDILWTNSNPSVDFNAQTINVANMSDYDEIKIVYKHTTTSNAQRVSDNYQDQLTLDDELEFNDGTNYYLRTYTIKFATNEITFGQSSIPGVSYHNETNIPLYVIGYKSGLFI